MLTEKASNECSNHSSGTINKLNKMTTTSPYEYHNNTLCVKSAWLIESKVLTKSTYDQLTYRGWLVSARRGGNGREALVEFESMRTDIKQKVVALAGDPHKVAVRSLLQDMVLPDSNAALFYSQYRKDNGEPLSNESQIKYTTNACILNAVGQLLANEISRSRAFGTRKKTIIWERIAKAVNELQKFQHSIPSSARRVQRLYEQYKQEGYACLIHGNEGNKHGEKITYDVGKWLLAMFCLPNKIKVPVLADEYKVKALVKGWPELSEQEIRNFLERPKNKRVWTLARDGKDAWKNQFSYKMSRDKARWFPNCYWAIDGTKFDIMHYEANKQGMASKSKINLVVDVFSEKIIGFSLSETEDHTDHFIALKQAFKTAGCRPYLITYDNQSGHKSKRMQQLYNSAVARNGGTHYAHRAYRHSNPIEQILNRIQQQQISPLWFSDKQGVRTRLMSNRANMEFIMQNKERLFKKEDLIKVWEYVLEQWNTSEHPKFPGQTRNEVYAHQQLELEPVDVLDMVEMFWLNETKPITYKAGGLLMKLAGKEYEYEVRTADGKIDTNFRRLHIGEKFIVRYDPEYMNDYVQLFKETATGLVHVADATPKVKYETIPALMYDGERSVMQADLDVVNIEFEQDMATIKALQQETGITPEKLMEDQEYLIKMGGLLPKQQRNEVESSFLRM